MSLTRYAPQILDAFRLMVTRPAASAVIVVPGLALVAGANVLGAQGGNLAGLGMMLSMLAVTGMGFFWQRTLAEGETLTPIQMAPRLILWMVILQLLQGFELAPTILFGLWLKDMPNAEIYTRTGIQVFQLLIGGLFLALPQLALGRWKDMAGTKLQEMVLSGGIAIGLGYVIVNLPFIMVTEVAKGLFADFASDLNGTVVTMTLQVVHALNMVVMAGYFALVWAVLKDQPSRFDPPAETPVDPKERRTTRITRTSKARK